jgi:hypothetical protein
MWWGLFPIPFILIGLAGLLFGTGFFPFNKQRRHV